MCAAWMIDCAPNLELLQLSPTRWPRREPAGPDANFARECVASCRGCRRPDGSVVVEWADRYCRCALGATPVHRCCVSMRTLTLSIVAGALGLCLSLIAGSAHAEAAPAADHYFMSVHGETHAALFQHAFLPGTAGAVIADETMLPVYQYVQLAARDLNDAPRHTRIEMQLSAWSRGQLATSISERPLDGDVQSAHVLIRRGPVGVRIGRQHVAGGAARYARFDGVALEAELGAFDAQVYAGLTVLPRWNERPSYVYLGAAVEARLRDPALWSGPRARGDYWLGGARLGWRARQLRAGLSFHEQREAGGLARRTLTLDGTTELSRDVSAGASGSAELEAERLSEGRAWLEAAATKQIDLSLEWLHTEPALFLSRQSVLSVFSTAHYDEAGGRAVVRASPRIALEGAGWAELYEGARPGARGELSLGLIPNRTGSAYVRLAYTRVLTPDNGYHSLRASLSERLLNRLSGTLEFYAYLYDRSIAGYRSSNVYAGNLEYRATGLLGLLWGASLVRSPYASLDIQSQVRLAYDFDFATTRPVR